MTDVPPSAALNLGAGQVLTGPAASLLVARALALAERVGQRDGIGASPQLVALRAAFDRAAQEARFEPEPANFPQVDDVAVSPPVRLLDPVGVGEVARILGCSPQWARSLLRRGAFTSALRRSGGRSSAWLVDRLEVEAAARCGHRCGDASDTQGAAA